MPHFLLALALGAMLTLPLHAQSPVPPEPDTHAMQAAADDEDRLARAWNLYVHNQKEEALRLCDELASNQTPAATNALHLRGIILADTGRGAEAIRAFDRVLAGHPDNAEVCNAKAWVLATSKDDTVRDGKLAVELATRATQLTAREDGAVLDTLAAAYAEAGNFEQAVATQLEAIKLLMNSPAASGAEQRLADYQQGRPYRE